MFYQLILQNNTAVIVPASSVGNALAGSFGFGVGCFKAQQVFLLGAAFLVDV